MDLQDGKGSSRGSSRFVDASLCPPGEFGDNGGSRGLFRAEGYMMRHAMAWTLVGLMLTAGCGDDSGNPDSGADAATDASTDAARDATVDSGHASGPTDAGVDAVADAGTAACDPYTAGSCPAGQKCSVVLAYAPDDTLDTISFGCVDADRAKGEAAPCSINRDATPDNLTANSIADDCQQGLFCYRSESAPGVSVCRPMCDGSTTDCGNGRYCIGLNSDPYFGLCQMAEGCDPVFQTGCGGGEACYVIGATNGDLLGTCFSPSTPDGGMPAAVGAPCMYLDSCQAGAGCFPEALPDGGFGDALCRSFCTVGDAGMPDAGSMDGGVADAGPFTGSCAGSATCLAIEHGDAGVLVPTVPGRCQ